MTSFVFQCNIPLYKFPMSRNAIGLNIGHGLCSVSGNVQLGLKLPPEVFSVNLMPFVDFL